MVGKFITTKKNDTLLVIDPSSSHLAYSLSRIHGDEQVFYQIGMLWTLDSWDSGQKFLYMFNALKFLLQEEPLADSVYTESFFVNFKQRVGSSSVPTVNNLLRMAITEVDPSIGFSEISPSTWRKILEIKPKKTNVKGKTKNDFKVPTRETVDSLLTGTIPEKITSNITNNQRQVPHDLSDCLAISIATGTQLGCKKFIAGSPAFINPIFIEKLKRIKNNVE